MTDVIVEDLPSDQPAQNVEVTNPNTNVSPLGSLELVNYFGLSYPSTEEKSKLNEIWSYVRSRLPEGGTEDILSEVLRIKGTVGEPRLGENQLDRVYRYVKLRKQERLIQQEIADVQGSANL